MVDRLKDRIDRALSYDNTCEIEDPWWAADGNSGCKDKISSKMMLWRNIFLGIKMLNLPEMTAGIKRTNHRIYNAWYVIFNSAVL